MSASLEMSARPTSLQSGDAAKGDLVSDNPLRGGVQPRSTRLKSEPVEISSLRDRGQRNARGSRGSRLSASLMGIVPAPGSPEERSPGNDGADFKDSEHKKGRTKSWHFGFPRLDEEPPKEHKSSLNSMIKIHLQRQTSIREGLHGVGIGADAKKRKPGRHRNRPSISGNIDRMLDKNNRELTTAEKVHAFLEEPLGSPGAFIFMLVIVFCIIISIILYIIRSSVNNDRDRQGVKGTIDAINYIFCAELVARMCSHIANNLNPAKQLYLWIDFLSIFPFLLEIALEEIPDGVKAFNALRVLRLLKLGRYYNGFDIFSKSLKMSFEALLVPLSFFLIFGLFCAVLLFHIENGNENQCTNGYGADHFIDIPQTIWFIMVTMTTVGYGDLVPCTPQGKIMTVVTMLGGVIFMAMPIAVIGTNFTQTWANKEQTLIIIRFKEMIRVRRNLTWDDCSQLFSYIAGGGGQHFDYGHMRQLVKMIDLSMTSKEVHSLFNYYDEDEVGKVEQEKILRSLYMHRYKVADRGNIDATMQKSAAMFNRHQSQFIPASVQNLTARNSHADSKLPVPGRDSIAEVAGIRENQERILRLLDALAAQVRAIGTARGVTSGAPVLSSRLPMQQSRVESDGLSTPQLGSARSDQVSASSGPSRAQTDAKLGADGDPLVNSDAPAE